MDVEITQLPKITVVKSILMKWDHHEERAEFWLIKKRGRTLFHWLNEPRSGELDECENAVSRLCKALGVMFEKEAIY